MEENLSEKGDPREDLISKLPDSLISQILSYLHIKEAVRTSVLSQRWRSLWLLIPNLDLDSTKFPDYSTFVSFMDKFVDSAKEKKSCLCNLKLNIRKDESDPCCVTHWIEFAATPKLKHLDVEFGPMKPECLEIIPVSLYICEKLVHLRLHRVSLVKFECVSSLPCLKTMRLEQNIYANESGPESLISSCPVLEDLSIRIRAYEDVKVLRVHSPTLTRLSIKHGDHDYEIEGFVEDYVYDYSRVLIDAPRLKYLNLKVCIVEFKCMSKWDYLTKVNIGGGFNLNDNEARNFFNCISEVVDMKISEEENFELIMYAVPFPPKFCNISCLEVQLRFWFVEELPTFLESIPNLKSLILDLYESPVGEETRLSSVPQCLLTSLEFVEIRSIFRGEPIEKELVRYILENSVILKKLVLHLDTLRSVVLRDIFPLPRRSNTCNIVVIRLLGWTLLNSVIIIVFCVNV